MKRDAVTSNASQFRVCMLCKVYSFLRNAPRFIKWNNKNSEKKRSHIVCPGRGYPCAIVIEAVGQCLWEIVLDRDWSRFG